MFCKACGRKIDDGSQYCSYCGTKQSQNSIITVEQQIETSYTHTKPYAPPPIIHPLKPKYDETYEKDSVAMMAGIILLLISFAIAVLQPFNFDSYESAQQGKVFLSIGSLIVRIFGIMYCVNLAKNQNRETFGWGLLAFFFPSIALIILGNTKKLYSEEEQKRKSETEKQFNKDDEYKQSPTYQNFPLLTIDGLIDELSKVKPYVAGVTATEFILAIASIITWKPSTTTIPNTIDSEKVKTISQILTHRMNFSRVNDFYLKNAKSVDKIFKFEREMTEFLELT